MQFLDLNAPIINKQDIYSTVDIPVSSILHKEKNLIITKNNELYFFKAMEDNSSDMKIGKKILEEFKLLFCIVE